MINYTERITLLMHDIVSRVPVLSFIDIARVLVFARFGRADAEGAFATCHCLTLPQTDPGYYYWRDRRTGRLTRCSEWFVTKSPVVSIGGRRMAYLFSFALPRFCDQTLARSSKEDLYPGWEPWTAKLDTVVHELYHIHPKMCGIRRIERTDGTVSDHAHSPVFFEQVRRIVGEYLASDPNPATYEFLRDDFAGATARFGGVVGTTFRTFPSYPQRYVEVVPAPALPSDLRGVKIEPIKSAQQPSRYTEDDLHIRQFMPADARRLVRRGRYRAA